ncbi:MAG TPA: TetR/AcrR family transcriptional regulator [Candidatus Dormibacteraeota bacterium]|nr:TetR/AcrR family transcriptional regulator [Candidatus Dormibacteraeota bacterium]
MTDQAQVSPVGAGEDAAGTFQRMLVIAARLFWTKGYAATTTREIARLVGLQKGSLYHHIEGKEELLYRLCIDALERVQEAAEQSVRQGTGATDRLRRLIHHHVTSMLADRDKHATMLIELRSLTGERRSEVIRLRDRYEALVGEVIAEGQREGVFRADIEPRYLTLSLLNLLNWTIFWFDPERPLSPEALSQILSTIYIEGVNSLARRPDGWSQGSGGPNGRPVDIPDRASENGTEDPEVP